MEDLVALENTTSTSTQTGEQVSFFRHPADWMFMAGAIALAPMLWLFAKDFWLRTDLQFFLIAFIVAAVLFIRRMRLEDPGRGRVIASFSLGILALLLLVVAWLLWSTWFATAAFGLLCVAWGLGRFGGSSWISIVASVVPVFGLLAFPMSDAYNGATALEWSVASSTSSLLDFFRVPQMAVGPAIQVRAGLLSTAGVCRGLGNPYLIFLAVLIISIFTKRSLLISLISLLTVPFWAWSLAVFHMSVAILLVENFGVDITVGAKSWLFDVLFLAIVLVAIWLMEHALEMFFRPFIAVSQTSGGFHTFYNHAVVWPYKEPKSQERSSDDSSSASSPPKFVAAPSWVKWPFLVAAVLFLLLSPFQFLGLFSAEVKNRMPSLSLSTEKAASLFQESLLPETIGDMSRIRFDTIGNDSLFHYGNYVTQWTYANQNQPAVIGVEFPFRGMVQIEKLLKNANGREFIQLDPSQADVPGLGTVQVDEMEIEEPLLGRTYLCVLSFSPTGGPLLRTPATSNEINTSLVLNSVTLQPSVITVRILVEGLEAASETAKEKERKQYRDMLLQACQQLAPAISQISK